MPTAMLPLVAVRTIGDMFNLSRLRSLSFDLALFDEPEEGHKLLWATLMRDIVISAAGLEELQIDGLPLSPPGLPTGLKVLRLRSCRLPPLSELVSTLNNMRGLEELVVVSCTLDMDDIPPEFVTDAIDFDRLHTFKVGMANDTADEHVLRLLNAPHLRTLHLLPQIPDVSLPVDLWHGHTTSTPSVHQAARSWTTVLRSCDEQSWELQELVIDGTFVFGAAGVPAVEIAVAQRGVTRLALPEPLFFGALNHVSLSRSTPRLGSASMPLNIRTHPPDASQSTSSSKEAAPFLSLVRELAIRLDDKLLPRFGSMAVSDHLYAENGGELGEMLWEVFGTQALVGERKLYLYTEAQEWPAKRWPDSPLRDRFMALAKEKGEEEWWSLYHGCPGWVLS